MGRKKGIQRMVKHNWYERSHWTYKEICGWLIERAIVAFHWQNSQDLHWSIFPLEKWNVLWESPKSFRLDSEVLTEEKTREKHGEKKGTKMISLTLTVMQLPVTSFPVKSRTTSRSTSNTSPIHHDIVLTILYMIVLSILAQDVYQISVPFY